MVEVIKMKRIVSLLASLLIVFSLVACSGGIQGKEAKETVTSFFEAVEDGDYAAAEGYLHPDRPADLEAFFEGVEVAKGVDFSSVDIEKYTGFKSSFYDSTVGGSAYSLMMRVSISGVEAEMEIELVRNEAGYGIYNFDMDVE